MTRRRGPAAACADGRFRRQTAAARKQQKAKEEKEKYDKMSPEEQAKFDEKKYKSELKKRGGMFGRTKVMRG
jgi:hypothetical protein